MPKTRSRLDRAEKIEEILDAAEARLLGGGYQHMSVAAIARDLGVAQNSLHWYFGSKDELFVAVLRRLLQRLAATKPPPRRGLGRQVLWGADYLHDFAPLRAAIRERALQSDLVAEFERELHALLRRVLMHALEPCVPPSELDLAATTLMATVEGTFVGGLSRPQRHRVIGFALRNLAG